MGGRHLHGIVAAETSLSPDDVIMTSSLHHRHMIISTNPQPNIQQLATTDKCQQIRLTPPLYKLLWIAYAFCRHIIAPPPTNEHRPKSASTVVLASTMP